MDKPVFYEFFAGGGMARAGLGPGWRCVFANDMDAKKANSYRANWGDDVFHLSDVRALSTAQTPGRADLMWGSFPCQDLSLAGMGAGLEGARSGSFWPFWRLVQNLAQENRAPKTIVLENVCGALTANGGTDFTRLCEAFAQENYSFGAFVLDAALFVPQSRPRLFFIAAHQDLIVSSSLRAQCTEGIFHPSALHKAYKRLASSIQANWIWWRLPEPPIRNMSLQDIIDIACDQPAWRSDDQTQALLDMMTPANLEKVHLARQSGLRQIGALYRRTRKENGVKVQRAEVRFDDLAGCLRTPAGGSSRQYILLVEQERVRARLLSARESARLMGLPDTYILPPKYTDAYHLTGDGVVAPVVRHLAAFVLEPLLRANGGSLAA